VRDAAADQMVPGAFCSAQGQAMLSCGLRCQVT